ncbi:uncharacterized protein LOC115973165 isoform X4 [Quercus lobata]|uniref:uncharacterized protein LOC115955540 isoform X4 n=1 Tax=Quercus lobata TaxID=97700 RepID=UPI0012464D77|nr:uncharacterized protein LOC115955540 isoform X4 [Quercus lobata]XP_030949273.1 uncharacterized protein LOC115973165 isoform X4 [Quercus lobata]
MMMWVLSCASTGYPTHSLRASFKTKAKVRSSSQVSVSLSTHHHQQQQQQQQLLLHHHQDHPFVPEVVKAVDSLYSEFRAVDNLVACNTARVLKAFQNARVGSHHFGGCTGYGHDEAGGREALDQAFAEIVGAESAIVRSQFFSGTHAITCALFAFLRPGDELLAVAGAPYDTLEEVIGKRDSYGLGSLKDFGVNYREVPLAGDGGLDWDALVGAVKPQTRCALIQRSCGYSWRQSLSVNEIGRAIKTIKMQNPNCLVMVDNCYGEFVESIEPPMVGADLIAGSLIKNPGGTIAPCGGYVAGKEKWVKAAAARLSAPGLGVDCGSTPGDIMRAFFQGLFLSPQMVGEAIKVIFADGTFIDGSTSELSCDGPLREPFAVYCQGGTHWTQWGLVLGEILKSI